MDTIVSILGVYFSLGLFALCVLDIVTGRIRTRLKTASVEAQSKLAVTGNYVGGKTSKVLVLGALWLLWPVAIYGALTPSKEEKSDG